MSDITIKQAQENDIPTIEGILRDTVNWLNEMGQPLWSADEVTWDKLSGNPQTGAHYISGNYKASDFYIAYLGGAPAGCMALIDYDPSFWPDVKKGESLFIHKLAVTKAARRSGVSDALMDFFKERGKDRGVKALRLDTDASRKKTRAFYERHGFVLVNTRMLGPFDVAFYVYDLPKLTCDRNENGRAVTVNTPNAETVAALLEAERIVKDPSVRRYSDVEEALRELRKS
jgi:GNAT superfamily N-acetyltransferase